MNGLLMDERFTAVFPSLVRALGGDLCAAAVLQAIHFRAQLSNGEWATIGLASIGNDVGISRDQAHRATLRLRESGVLVAEDTARGYRMRWRIDHEALEALHEGVAKSRQSKVSRNRDGSGESVADTRHQVSRQRDTYKKSLEEDKPKKKELSLTDADAASAFVNFWDVYPRKVGKRSTAVALIRALQRASADEIIAGAARLAGDPNLPDQRFIPHPSTWLNRDGWLDEPLPPLRSDDRVSGTERYLRAANTPQIATHGLSLADVRQIGSAL